MGRCDTVGAWVVVVFGGVATVVVVPAVPGLPRVGGGSVVDLARVGGGGGVDVVVVVRLGAVGAGVVVVRLNLRVGGGVVGRVAGWLVFPRVGCVGRVGLVVVESG